MYQLLKVIGFVILIAGIYILVKYMDSKQIIYIAMGIAMIIQSLLIIGVSMGVEYLDAILSILMKKENELPQKKSNTLEQI
jgi:hypothetical protein